MRKAVPVIGFSILAVMTLLLFGLAAIEAWRWDPLPAIVMSLTLLALLYETTREGQGLWRAKPAHAFGRNDLYNFVAVFLGALVTYILSVDVGLGAVSAAGLVGVVTALILPKYGVPIYCGAFVGMASHKLLCQHGSVMIAGGLAGLVYVLSTGVFDGFGGKLGTIAFTGCVITGLLMGRDFVVLNVPAWTVGWLIILYSVIATVVTFYLSIHLGHGPVMASGIVGLAGGLILPAVYPEIGSTLAVMVICASFAGMSNAKRFPHIMPMFAAGVLCGLFFIYSMPYLGGAGGKLGTIAFGSVIAVRGSMDLLSYFQTVRRHLPHPLTGIH